MNTLKHNFVYLNILTSYFDVLDIFIFSVTCVLRNTLVLFKQTNYSIIIVC